MNIKKQIQSELAYSGQTLVKAASFQLVPFLAIAGQVPVLWFSCQAELFPDHDARMNIISCCAQIIAGLYGITLAGYTFFLSRIDALMAADMTLDYIVSSVKRRFKYLIWYITGTVAIALLISVFLMYYPESSGIIPDYPYRVIVNEFILFVVFATGLILYYSVGVVNPNCIEKEARKLKNRLEFRFSPAGNVVEFLSLYDQIRNRCNAMVPQSALKQIHENKGRQFACTIELLQDQQTLPRPLLADLRRIHRYYECCINCSPMTVSQDMCLLARKAAAFLNQETIHLPGNP